MTKAKHRDLHGEIVTYTLANDDPITISADQIASSGRVVIAAFGGKVGDDVMNTDNPSQQFKRDERVLVALTYRRYWDFDQIGLPMTETGPGWTSVTKYTISVDSIATTAGDIGRLSWPLDELIQALRDAAAEYLASEHATPETMATP